MVLLRTFDAKAIALQRTGKMGTYASTLGQEAIATAVGHAMKKEDVLCPYYREYGAQLQRGVTMTDLYRYWGGDERGSCYDSDNDDLPISVPIASQCLHAVGVASAFKLRKQPRVAVTFVGDGGTSEGDFYEAINVAGVWNLPVVFMVNNNQWAISVPRKKQTHTETIAQKAIAAGIEGLQVDGNDIIALRHAVGNALDKARDGEGATLIEAITYRLCDHTTADDAKRYADPIMTEEAWKKEPIARLKTYLTEQDKWDDTKEKALKTECSKKVENAVKQYFDTPAPKTEDFFDYLYVQPPRDLMEQREYAIAIKEICHG